MDWAHKWARTLVLRCWRKNRFYIFSFLQMLLNPKIILYIYIYIIYVICYNVCVGVKIIIIIMIIINKIDHFALTWKERMKSRDKSMSLNIPSSLPVKPGPHSVWLIKNQLKHVRIFTWKHVFFVQRREKREEREKIRPTFS